MVFAGFYPSEGTSHEELREAIEKLTLNDSSLTYEPESSPALGIGFRCGFLGLLHKEIVQERLEREYSLSIVTTAPSVRYRITSSKDETYEIESPAQLPNPQYYKKIEEPYIEAIVITPDEFLGNVLKLLQNRRGVHRKMEYIGPQRVYLTYDLPLAEVLYDFFNKLKSISQGYASFDYELKDYRESPLVKLDILINQDPVDALAVIVHKDKAYNVGNLLTSKMKEVIPRQLFEVVIQAAINKRVIAKTVVKAAAQERPGQVLRRRHLAQDEAAGKAEKRQEAHEAHRQDRHPPGSLPGRAGTRRLAAKRAFPRLQSLVCDFSGGPLLSSALMKWAPRETRLRRAASTMSSAACTLSRRVMMRLPISLCW